MADILIIGGDRRQIELGAMLGKKGHNAGLCGFDKLGFADAEMAAPDYVFLPVPYRMPDGYIKAPFAQRPYALEAIVAKYPNSAYVLGGGDSVLEAALSGARCLDLLADEAFLVRNALLTAQAAVCAFVKESAAALCDLSCVVVGYGRIGKFLCRLLMAHGAKVKATARRESDLELIRIEGCEAFHTRDAARAVCCAEAIWNTVPVHVLGPEALSALRRDAKVVELASPPYGMDIEAAKKMGVDVRLEQGLPGRYFPVSAARAMMDVFEREER